MRKVRLKECPIAACVVCCLISCLLYEKRKVCYLPGTHNQWRKKEKQLNGIMTIKKLPRRQHFLPIDRKEVQSWVKNEESILQMNSPWPSVM